MESLTIFTSSVIVDHIISYYFPQQHFAKSLGMTCNCIWSTEITFEIKKQKYNTVYAQNSFYVYLILGDPRGSVGSGEKAGRKFSGTGKRAPGYRLSPNYAQKFKRMPAPDWAQKMLCIIVPNRRTVSPEFFSWVRTRRLLSRHTCPVRSPSLCVQGKLLFSTFLTRNEGTTDESKKRLGCYQQEQFNLPREYSVFDGSQCIVNNRKFKMRRRRESQISNSFTRQNNNFAHASHFLVHFLCRQLHDYPWKCRISRFVKDVKKQWQNSFSSWTRIRLIEIQKSRRVRLHVTK